MTSVVSILNGALAKLGSSDRLIDILDDTRNGRAFNSIYADKRDLELSEHPWTFAMARASIPASVTVPAFGWGSAFPKPAGCLRVVEVGDRWVLYDGQDPGFEFEGADILCNESSPLNIKYIQRVTNTGLWHPMFVELMECRLAFETCLEITGSESKKEGLWKEHDEALKKAKRMQAIYQPPVKTARGTWSQALMGYWR